MRTMTNKRKPYRYLVGDKHRGLPVNNKGGNLLNKRLNALNSLVATAMEDHRRLLFARFDLRLPQGLEVNTSEITNRFIRKLKKLWNAPRRGKLHYIWCKEREKAKGDHWHFGFIIDDAENRYHHLAEQVDKAWRYAVSPENTENNKTGLVQRVRYMDGISKRTNRLEVAEVIYWWSYLCKHREDAEVTRGNFRTSRVDRNAILDLALTEDEKQQAVKNNRNYVTTRDIETKEKARFNKNKKNYIMGR